MAKQKQQPVKQQPVQPKKQKTSSGNNTFSYLLRNLIIIAGFAFVFFIIWSRFSKEQKYSELTRQFYQLRSQNPNSPELRDIYNEIMQIQPEVAADTGYFTRLTRGYHWAINDMALGSLDDIKDREEQLSKLRLDSTPASLLEAKRSMKIGLYDFMQHINKATPPNAVILLPYGDSAISNNGKWNFIYDPEWAEYFLYPRLCVASVDAGKTELAKRVTHVIIIEGKGYDKLKYDVPVEQRVREAVLPIDHPPVGPQTTN